jgi:hypothetical protein
MPLLRRIEVWRSYAETRAICYNCVENLDTGRFRVCTADFVEYGASRDANQERYFVEQMTDWSPDDPEQPQWFDSLPAAIAAHDADFEN